jgi:hypothetical protein
VILTNEARRCGGAGPLNACPLRGQNNPEIPQSSHVAQAAQFDHTAVESHVRLIHSLAGGCEGFLLLTPIFEGQSPRPQRFAVGAITAMVGAIMAFDGAPGVNLYAQYGTMRRDLAPGKKGGECDVEAVFAAVADIDNDKHRHRTIAIEPSYVVESSPGNFQNYIFPKPMPVRGPSRCYRLFATPLEVTPGQKIARMFGASPET